MNEQKNKPDTLSFRASGQLLVPYVVGKYAIL